MLSSTKTLFATIMAIASWSLASWAGNGFMVSIQTVNSGYSVASNDGGPSDATADRPWAYSDELELINLNYAQTGCLHDGDGFNLLNPYSGYYFSAQCGGGSQPGTNCGIVQVNRTVAYGWEYFTAHKVSGSPGRVIRNGDRFEIQSSAGFYCTAEGGGGPGEAFTCNRTVANGWENFGMSYWDQSCKE